MILINLSASAQVKDRDLKNVVDSIKGSYTPVTKDAIRIISLPSINDTTKKIPVSKYSLIDKKLSTNFEVEPIKAAKMKGEPLVKIYRSYVKGGFGNYATPLFEAYYNSMRSKNFLYTARFNHLSSNGSLNDSISNGAFSNNNLGLSGKYFIDKHTIEAGFDYDRKMVNYYGRPSYYNSTIDNFLLDTRQRFNLFSGNAVLSSNYADSSRINHDITLKYYNLSDLYLAKENNLRADAKVSWFYGKEFIVATGYNDFYYNNTALDSSYNNLFSVGFEGHSKYGKLKFKLGGNAVIESMSEKVSYPHGYGNVDVNYNVIDNILIPYAGLSGKLERNSYYKMALLNPFMKPTTMLKNTNEKVKFYGGLRGSLSSTVSFNTSVSYSNVADMAFFINDTNLAYISKFDVVYDDAKVLNIHGEMAYQKFEKLRILAQADYYKYKMTKQLYPWHKPTLEVTLSAKYNLRDKILVKTDIFYQNSRKALDYYEGNDPTVKGPFPMTLKGFADVNLGAEYRYSKHLSAFLNFNNIGALKYSRWYNYPMQRFNLMGGLTYSF